MQLSELIIRLMGPIIFAAAFVVFIMNYNTVDEYIQVVKDKLIDGEVYRQSYSSDDYDEKAFNIVDGSYTVTGTYLIGYLNGTITNKVIVNSEGGTTPYKKLIIDPHGLNQGASYALYSRSLSPGNVNGVVLSQCDKWIPGESINLNQVVHSDRTYLFEPQYADTGVLESITFTLQ